MLLEFGCKVHGRDPGLGGLQLLLLRSDPVEGYAQAQKEAPLLMVEGKVARCR